MADQSSKIRYFYSGTVTIPGGFWGSSKIHKIWGTVRVSTPINLDELETMIRKGCGFKKDSEITLTAFNTLPC